MRYLFKRSEINPSLDDVWLEVDLAKEELDIITEIHNIETTNLDYAQGWMNGSTHIRQYHVRYSIAFGAELTQKRNVLFQKFQNSYNFLVEKLEIIKYETPNSYQVMLQISQKLKKLIQQK